MPTPVRSHPRTSTHMGRGCTGYGGVPTARQPDQLITYIELSEIAGFDVQASRNAPLSARKYVRDVSPTGF